MRSLLLAPVLAVALASPAVAATPSYDIDVAAKLSGTASGTDSDGWTSSSKFSTNIGQTYRGLPGKLNKDGDEEASGDASVPPQFAMTTLDQQYALSTVAGVISWSCAPDGQADGAPGSVSVTRLDDEGSLYMFLLDDKVTQARDCDGFSSFADTIDISKEPVTVPPTHFPWSQLAKGSVTVPIDRMVNCGEWTIYQTACSLRLTGSVTIRRSMVEDPPKEETPEPEPEETGYQPAEDGTEVSSKPRPATRIKVKGSPWHGGKGAKVKVTCSAACKGKVSVKAAPKGGKSAKPIGSKSFSSTGGTKKITVIYGKGGARAARQRGAVIIKVNAAGRSSSFRMKTK